MLLEPPHFVRFIYDMGNHVDSRELAIEAKREFTAMHRHSLETYQALRKFEGFYEIALWACYQAATGALESSTLSPQPNLV
jgi:hypothetical protein